MRKPIPQPQRVVRCGALVAILGFLILIGWHNDLQTLLRVRKEYIPVPYSVGLCLIASGFSLMASYVQSLRPIATIGSVGVVLFSCLTGLQHLLPVFSVHILPPASGPTLMAPNTALCFALANAALLSSRFYKSADLRISLMLMPAMVILTLSSAALLGYLLDFKPAYSWGTTDMALHTSWGLFILGYGLFTLGHSDGQFLSGRHWQAKVILLIILGVSLTLIIVQSLLANEQRRDEDNLAYEAERAARIVQVQYEGNLNVLNRMQARMEILDSAPEAWLQKTTDFLAHNPAFYSLALLNRDLSVRKSVYLETDPPWTELAQMARDDLKWTTGKTAIPVVKAGIIDGREAVIFFLPLHWKGRLYGTLAGAYDVNRQYLQLHDETNIHSPLIRIAPVIPDARSEDKAIRKTFLIHFAGTEWRVDASKNPANGSRNHLPTLLFVAGIILTLTLANNLFQSQKIHAFVDEMRRSEERLDLALSSANIGIWEWDNVNEKISWGGHAFKLLGGTDNAALPDNNTTLRARMPEEDRDRIDRDIALSIDQQARFSIQFRLKRLDDSREVWLQSSGKVVEQKDGAPVRSSGVIIDITDLKNKEKYLLRSNQELEQFAYVASHDLKAPLRSIDNLAKWVIEDTAEQLPADARDKLEILRGRIRRLEKLLEDILSYSRAGRITEPAAEIDVSSLFENLHETFVPAPFVFESETSIASVKAPRTPLEQVLGNLLANSVKHHDQGGGRIKLSLTREKDYYKFTVSDDGPGIPPQFHDRVFQMFQTLQSRDKVDGSGLGMAIVKKLVEWQGGKVWIEATEGRRGTSVCVLWPTAQTAT